MARCRNASREDSGDEASKASERIKRFGERANAVLETSLARRMDLATLGTTMRILQLVGEPMQRIEREHPPEDELVTAAVKLRPLIDPTLGADGVLGQSAMNSIGFLIRSTPQGWRDRQQTIRQAWHDFATTGYWAMSTADVSDRADWRPWRWDREIARDWLYGDIIHADRAAAERLRYVPMAERLLAGTLWAKDGVLLARATIQFVADLREAGMMPA